MNTPVLPRATQDRSLTVAAPMCFRSRDREGACLTRQKYRCIASERMRPLCAPVYLPMLRFVLVWAALKVNPEFTELNCVWLNALNA